MLYWCPYSVGLLQAVRLVGTIRIICPKQTSQSGLNISPLNQAYSLDDLILEAYEKLYNTWQQLTKKYQPDRRMP